MDIVTYVLCKNYIKKSLAGAGALKGEKGDAGKSAFEVAQAAGFKGTEAQWLESLKGKDGSTPYIGDNGNWFINNTDTNIPGRAIRSYNELRDLPDIPAIVIETVEAAGYAKKDDIPTLLSELENDVGFITSADLPTSLSELNNDVGYITLNELEDFAKKDEIPTRLSELENDVGFISELKTINGESLVGTGDITLAVDAPVQDVRVNGESVVVDKIADITAMLNATMGRNFTTTITVGHLEEGTEIFEDDTIADILYRILYRQSLPTTVTLWFGGADEIPTSIDNLDWLEKIDNLEPDTLIANGFTKLTKTGNLVTEDGQYPVMACSESVKLVQLIRWNVKDAEFVNLPFEEVPTNKGYTIYYLPTRTYDEDVGGTNYVFTFGEKEVQS